MQEDRKITTAYAHALLEMAKESGSLQQVIDALQSLLTTPLLVSNAQHFYHPGYPAKTQKLLWELLLKKVTLPKILQNFLGVLLANHRIYMLPVIAKNFAEAALLAQGVHSGIVETAILLTDAELERLRLEISELLKLNVRLTQHVNHDLLAGFIVDVGDKRLDASLANKLNKLKYQMKNSQ